MPKNGFNLIVLFTFLTGLSVCVSSNARNAEAFIVKDGKPLAEIVVAENPSRMGKLAAEELQTYIQKISGGLLPIVTKPTESVPVTIFVGESEFTKRKDLTVDDLEHGAFKMVSGDDWLALLGVDDDFIPPNFEPGEPFSKGKIVKAWTDRTGTDKGWKCPMAPMWRHHDRKNGFWGYDKHGSLNAVHEFLRGLGARWFMPGELGEVVPKMKSIKLPQVNERIEPDFAMRKMTFSKMGTSPREEWLWYLRLGLNQAYDVIGNPCGFSHGLTNVMDGEIMREAHPEYYALWAGKRMNEKGHTKPCLSSEGLARETVDYARTVFDVYDVPAVSIMPQDGYGEACQCDKCRGPESKVTLDRPRRGETSDYVWSFIDRVAREVHKTHPDGKIGCFAYNRYHLPPLSIDKLSPNVVVGVVHGRGGRFFRVSEAESDEDVAELRRQWLKLASNPLVVWEHYPFPHRGFFMPAYFPHRIAQALRSSKGESMGEFIEVPLSKGLHSPGFSHLNVYVTARCQWDADLNVDDLLDDYYQTFYGPTAAEMKAFIEYSENNWRSMEKDPDAIKKAFELIAEAKEKTSPDSVYGRRIALLLEYLRPLSDLERQLRKGRDGNRKAVARKHDDADIKIDGKLDEARWDSRPAHALVELETGRKPCHATSVKFIWRGDDLIMGIRCSDNDVENAKSTAEKADDTMIWHGDCVEILLETQSHSYYQIAIAPNGVVVDLDRQGDAVNLAWNSLAEVATSVDADGWTAEVRIPVSIADVPDDPNHNVTGRVPGKDFPWYFNVCRQRLREKGKELSAFSPTGTSGFHEPMRFGELEAR